MISSVTYWIVHAHIEVPQYSTQSRMVDGGSRRCFDVLILFRSSRTIVRTDEVCSIVNARIAYTLAVTPKRLLDHHRAFHTDVPPYG